MAAADRLAPYIMSCESDFIVIGAQAGERGGTMVRMLLTLVTVSIASSWCNWTKIKRLSLFFSHWLSGCLHQVTQIVSGTMVAVCWSTMEFLPVIQICKFIELTASNMFAITNLAICINLALIVSSHHTMTRVKSVSSPRLILLFLLISVAGTVAAVPFWDTWVVSQTLYWAVSPDEGRLSWVLTAMYFVEFGVGVFMTVIVALLLLFRMPELKQCWEIHRRIRFYFGLTITAIVANLGIGIGGMMFVLTGTKWDMLITASWCARHLHIALDTLVLYGVLGVSSTCMDEREEKADSSEAVVISGATAPHRYRSNTEYLPKAPATRSRSDAVAPNC